MTDLATNDADLMASDLAFWSSAGALPRLRQIVDTAEFLVAEKHGTTEIDGLYDDPVAVLAVYTEVIARADSEGIPTEASYLRRLHTR